MHILQSGQAKSGNYWLYTIIQEIISHSSIENKSYIQQDEIYPIAKQWKLSTKNQVDENVMDITPNGCFYRIGSIFRKPLEDVEAYIKMNTHVWTHSPFNITSEFVLPIFDKVVYIIRDPRDVILSMAKFSQTPYMKKYYPSPCNSIEDYVDAMAINMANSWSINVSRYIEKSTKFNIHVIFYEELLNNTEIELKRLSDYLEIELNELSVKEILDNISFNSMKKNNPEHVNKAKLYGWKSQMSPSLNAGIVDRIGPFLKTLNYPLSENDFSLPSIGSEFIPFRYINKPRKSLKMRLSLIKQAITF